MMMYARLLTCVAVLVCLTAGLWEVRHIGVLAGKAEVQAKWDREKREQAEAENAAILTRIRNNERLAEQQAADQQRIENGYKDEINKVNSAYTKFDGAGAQSRLRIHVGACSGVASPTQTTSASTANADLAATIVLPAKVDRDLRDLMQEADTMLATCRAAQDFIVSSEMAAH